MTIKAIVPNDFLKNLLIFGVPYGGTYVPVPTPIDNTILSVNGSGVVNWRTQLPSGITCLTPTSALQVVNKQYADMLAASGAGVYATATAALTSYTYSNGVAGVGATLTAPSNGVFTIDGVSPPVGANVLIPLQSDTTTNGIYTVTTSSSSAPAVLTRASNYDTPTQINDTGMITSSHGTVNIGLGFYLTSYVTTIGTSVITYAQFGVASTDLLGGVLGSVPYQSAPNTTLFVAPNTTTTLKVFTQTGTGSAGALPAWLTATNAATASTIMLRDSSGNVISNSIQASSATSGSGFNVGGFQNYLIDLRGPGASGTQTYSQIHLVSNSATADDGFYINGTTGPAIGQMYAGAALVNNSVIAKATTASGMWISGSGNVLSIFNDSGLTIGSPYTPTNIFTMVSGGSFVMNSGAVLRTGTTAGNSFGFSARDTTNNAFRQFMTFTAGLIPSCAIANQTNSTLTIDGATIGSITPAPATFSTLNIGSSALVLAGNLSTVGAFASIFTMTGATNVTFPTSGTLATTAGSVANLTGGVLGSVPYQSAPNTTLFVSPNTSTALQVFSQTGTGSAGALPVWLTATSAATASTIASRDGSGNSAFAQVSASIVLVSGATNPLIRSIFTGPQSTTSGGGTQNVQDDGTALSINNRLGSFSFLAAYDTSHTYNVGAAMRAFATQNWTSSANGTQLQFLTTPNNTITNLTALTLNQDQSANFANNVYANNHFSGQNTFTTSQTLTILSPYSIYMSGSTANQVMTLPVVTNYTATGAIFMFMNNSSVSWTINSSGANPVITLPSNCMILVECILLTGTTAASWNAMPITYMTPLSFTNGANVTATITNGVNLALAPTGSSAVANGFLGYDSNSNANANNFFSGSLTSSTSSITLTVASPQNINITTTGNTSLTLPVAATLANGVTYRVANSSTGTITVSASGGSQLAKISGQNAFGVFTVVNTAGGTGNASWSFYYSGDINSTGSSLVVRDGSGNVVYNNIARFNTFQSSTVNASTAGILTLATSDSIGWRNFANSGNVLLSKDSNDNLNWPNNINANNHTNGFQSIATATGSTTLTIASSYCTDFTGTAVQTVVLPVPSTLTAGFELQIRNHSTLTVTVNTSGANLIAALTNLQMLTIKCILNSGTGTASWSWYVTTLLG